MAGARIQVKRGTAASWASNNPILYVGELGFETDTKKLKFGDGTTAWNSLQYTVTPLSLSALNDLGDVTITSVADGDFLRWNGSVWINDAVNLSTDTIGSYVESLVAGTGITLSNNSGEGATPTVAIGQSVATSASVTFAHVSAPVTGNVVGNLTGNADTATVLDNARTIELSGDVTGSVSFDGSANVNIITEIQPNSVALGTDTTGNYMLDLTQGTGVTVTHTPGEGSNATIAIGQNVATSSSVTFAHVSAPLTGNVIGNASTATTLQNARIIQLIGDLSGSVSFDGSADVLISALVEPNSVTLGQDTTGSYVQDIYGGTGVTVTHTPGEGSSASIAIGQDVSTSASVTFGQVIISGDLTVSGTTTTLNTQDLLVEDNVIVLNSNVTGAPSGTAGIEIERGSSDNVQLRWNETTDSWEITEDGTNYKNIASGQDVETSASVTFAHVSAPLTGNVLGNLTGNVTGNADTATTLATPRTIQLTGDVSGSASFDGSANASITATISANSVALGTDTTGNYINSTAVADGLVVRYIPEADIASYAGQYDNGASYGIGQIVSTGANSPYGDSGQLFVRVSNGGNPGYPPGTASWSVYNHETSSGEGSLAVFGVDETVMQARVTDVSDTEIGYLNGVTSAIQTQIDTKAPLNSPTFTGTVTLPNDTVALGSQTTGNYVLDVVSGTGITVSHTPGEGSTASVAINATLDNLNDVVVSSPAEFQSLAYDGTNWANQYAPVVSYVRNAEATTLTTGTVVYLFGGNGDHASVKRADNSSDVTSSKTVGVVGASIASNQNGPIITRGYVDGVNLSAYTVGDVLWLDANGQFTATKPSAPSHLVFVGVVVRANNNGIMYVATQNGYEIEELHDVKITGATDGQYLRYNSASGVWINDTINLGSDTTGDYVQNLVAGTGITITNNSGEGTTPTLEIGQSVATSASVTFARLETTGNVVIGGNLSVSGSVITENQASLVLDDPFIYLNGSSSASHPDLGIAGNYNDGSYKHAGFFRDATDGKFKFFDSYTPEPSSPIDTGHASYSPAPVVAETFESTATTGTAPFTVSSTTEVANLHADTATTLHTARAISLGGDLSGSASFDGSGNITITALVEPNSVALGTDTTGNYMSDLVEGTGVTIVHTPSEGSNATISIGQSVATSASVTFAHVSAPVTGNVVGNVTGNLTGNVTGNADTATELTTARSISLDGDLSGSASFDGSADVTITATIAANSVALGTDTTGNYMADIVDGTGITVVHTAGEGSTASVSLNASLNNLTDVDTTGVADEYFLKYVAASTMWMPSAIPQINTLDDIGDVTITSASAGHFLKWNGSAWINAFPSSTTVSDSAPANPSEGDIWFDSSTLDTFIRYDGAWLQVNAESSIQDLDDLFDVNIQNPQPNDFLKYDGTEWIATSSIIPVEISLKSTSYSLTTSDANKLIEMNSSSANTVTIPSNSTAAIPVGTRVEVVRRGTGSTQILAAGGVTIRSLVGTYISGQYGCATLVKRAANEWYVFGDLSAS